MNEAEEAQKEEEEEEEVVEEAREEDGDMRRRQSELFEAAEKGNDDAVEQLSVVSWWRGCPEARLTLDLTKMGGLCCTWRLNKGTRASFGCCSRSMPIRTRGLGFAELPLSLIHI